MKTEMINIQVKPLQIPVARFENLTEVLAHVNGDESKIVDVLNAYGQQKDALVDGRAYISEYVETEFGFKRLVKVVEVDGKQVEEDNDTDNDHVKRFIAEVASGQYTHAKLHIAGTNVETRTAEVGALLQAAINAKGPFAINLNSAIRESKPKKPADYAVKAAQGIITAKKQAEWASRFTNGYQGVPATAFEPFNTKPAKNATAEEVEQVHQLNVKNLAFAIMAREKAKAELAKADYAV